MERRLPRLFPPFKLHATLLALLALALLVAALGPRARAQERRPVDETPQSRVFGRIVDSKGAAVRGAKVELRAFELPWRHGEPRESFETTSDDTGKFDFTVPTPTSDGVVLTVRAGRHLDLATLGFGPAGGRGEPRLKSGDNDLRTLTLGPAGALTGRVIDERDQPISGALVRLAGKLPRGMERQTRSNARGEFELAHVPAGTYMLEALADGFRGAKLREKVVVVDRTTEGVEFMLFHAMTISGIVVDKNGVGVAKARVFGRPKHGGPGAGALTDADGRFVVHLLQNEPHRFDVEAEGFAKLDSFSDALERRDLVEGLQVEKGGLAEVYGELRGYWEQGSTDVRLVLDRAVLTRFVVLDAATSAPVPEFALTLEWKQIGTSSRKGGEPTFRRELHPHGEFECEADPRRHTYLIVASGYAPARGEILHDSAATRRCIVRLSRGGSITGQVFVSGKLVEGADVILRETTLEELFEGPLMDENKAYWSEHEGVFDPFWIDETRRKTRSDAEGRFRFDSLEAGDYRLEIKTKVGERRSMEPVKIAAGMPLDLGKVELLLAATLQGRVLTPQGTSAAGLDVSASVFDVTRFAKTDAEGRFRIPALPAGRAHVSIGNKPGVLARFPVQRFELAPDETEDVLLDATGSVGASISIVARIDGKPAVGLDVCAVSVVDPTLRARLGRTRNLGATKEWIPAIGECSVEFLAPSGMPVARLPKAAQLTSGAEVKLDLDLSVGRLAFEWPTLPPGERFRLVELEGRHSGRSELVRVDARPDDSVRDADLGALSDQRCEFRWVQPGEAEWTVRVLSSSATDPHIQRYYRRTVTVVAGVLAECQLTLEHQIEPPQDE